MKKILVLSLLFTTATASLAQADLKVGVEAGLSVFDLPKFNGINDSQRSFELTAIVPKDPPRPISSHSHQAQQGAAKKKRLHRSLPF